MTLPQSNLIIANGTSKLAPASCSHYELKEKPSSKLQPFKEEEPRSITKNVISSLQQGEMSLENGQRAHADTENKVVLQRTTSAKAPGSPESFKGEQASSSGLLPPKEKGEEPYSIKSTKALSLKGDVTPTREANTVPNGNKPRSSSASGVLNHLDMFVHQPV